MAKRVERIARKVLGANAGIMTDALTWAGTFHGIGARLLREHAEQIGLDPAFTIHDREDSADLMNLVRHERGFSKTETRFPTKGTCLSIYSRCVNAEVDLDQVLGASYPWCSGWAGELKELFAAYIEAKQKQNVLDYDDLLLYWAQMMSDAAIADDVGGRFDHVLVDEYQDTNRLQSSVLLALKPGGRGLTVVGDDAQSIYSFRAATVRNILDFPDQFSPKAEIVTLDRNYRSTQPILSAANGVINLAKERFTKNLWTERTSSAKPRLHGTLAAAAERGPVDFPDLLLTPGVGARTVRSLAMVAEVVHGAPYRFRDPARFSLAHGGKDRHPYPVPIKVYDETIRVMKSAVRNAKLARDEEMQALKRLDDQARRLERTAGGPSFGSFVATKRAASPLLDGRSVFGWEKDLTQPKAAESSRSKI
jgi:UvrD/REP helicase N-terminal domain/Protein of unknown function (DUF763)